MRIVRFLFLLFLLISPVAIGQQSKMAATLQAARKHTHNHCISKGGIGIIDTTLYIVAKSTKNELILQEGKRWTGQDVSKPETVVVYDNKVWPIDNLPLAFDKHRSTVIFFENNEVHFYSFKLKQGGYYKRIPPD